MLFLHVLLHNSSTVNRRGLATRLVFAARMELQLYHVCRYPSKNIKEGHPLNGVSIARRAEMKLSIIL